ncbi:MAG: Uma2 family endonuclease [Verrucomicrobiaceae bacterium]|nr:Uma2 family endonuclease [Verrucomicrobiaceae bacterium]
MALTHLHPGLQKRALPLSVKAWHEMIAKGLVSKRAELIRGVIIEKMSKSISHAKLSSRLLKTLIKALSDHFWVRSETPLTLIDSEPEPDLSVVAGAEETHRGHPRTAKLVIEVSVTTLAEDRDMIEIYAEAGVEEFWIVDAEHRCVEVHRQPVDGHYMISEVRAAGQVLDCVALPGVRVDVSELFAGI